MTLNTATAHRLASFVERIEWNAAERATLAELDREILKEAKGEGFDTAALKKIVALRKKDPDKLKEASAIEDTYIHALGALTGSPLGEWARAHMDGESAGRLDGVQTYSGIVVEQFSDALDEVAAARERKREMEAAE